MYIRELTTLIAVADQGSFLKAAKELYITPASVMNQMNKLSILYLKTLKRTAPTRHFLTPARRT